MTFADDVTRPELLEMLATQMTQLQKLEDDAADSAAGYKEVIKERKSDVKQILKRLHEDSAQLTIFQRPEAAWKV